MSLEEMKEGFQRAIQENPYDEVNHRAYSDWLEENGFDEEAEIQRRWTKEKQKEAEEFLDNYAKSLSSYPDYYEEEEGRGREVTVEELIETGRANLGIPKDKDGYRYGKDRIHLNFDTPGRVWSNREEFWKHFSVVTGIPVEDGYDVTFVSCSC
jgi:uncharacterized protein (TIGR02996 family)